MADVVRQHDEIFRRIERLAGAEKLAGKLRPEELRAAPGRPVHDENGVLRDPFRIFHRLAERPVMDSQLRHRLPGGELEIAQDEIALVRRGVIGREENGREKKRENQRSEARAQSHRQKLSQLCRGRLYVVQGRDEKALAR